MSGTLLRYNAALQNETDKIKVLVINMTQEVKHDAQSRAHMRTCICTNTLRTKTKTLEQIKTKAHRVYTAES